MSTKTDPKKTTVDLDEPTENLPAAAPAGGALVNLDFGDDAGAGLENVELDEFRIPIFRILQSNSPQCRPPQQGGIAGARPGMVLNTQTGEVFDGEKGLDLLPCHRDHNYGEFIPRDENGGGGGFVGLRPIDDPLVLEARAKHGKFGKLPTPDGNELVETFYLFGLFHLPTDVWCRGIVTFSSTQVKKYQAFMGRVLNLTYVVGGKRVQPPMWAHRWRLTTVYETKGQFGYYGWRLTLAEVDENGVERPPVASLVPLRLESGEPNPLYVEGKSFYELIKSGRASADLSAAAEAAAGATAGPSGDPDDEIPF